MPLKSYVVSQLRFPGSMVDFMERQMEKLKPLNVPPKAEGCKKHGPHPMVASRCDCVVKCQSVREGLMRCVRGAVLVFAVVLTGCVTAASYEEKLRTVYLGKPITVAIEKNGLPAKSVTLPDGGAIYEWHHGRQNLRVEDTGPYATVSGGGPACITGFETDASGVVVRYYFRGNCR